MRSSSSLPHRLQAASGTARAWALLITKAAPLLREPTGCAGLFLARDGHLLTGAASLSNIATTQLGQAGLPQLTARSVRARTVRFTLSSAAGVRAATPDLNASRIARLQVRRAGRHARSERRSYRSPARASRGPPRKI